MVKQKVVKFLPLETFVYPGQSCMSGQCLEGVGSGASSLISCFGNNHGESRTFEIIGNFIVILC